MPTKSVAIKPGLYAIRHVDNCDGKGDICTSIARLNEKGRWTMQENNKEVLTYVGDKILSVWALDEATAMVSFDSLSQDEQSLYKMTPDERVAFFEIEEKELPLQAWCRDDIIVVAARSARQAAAVHASNIENNGFTGAPPSDSENWFELFDDELKHVSSRRRVSFAELLSKATGPKSLGKRK